VVSEPSDRETLASPETTDLEAAPDSDPDTEPEPYCRLER
jgi:hypothetical protein